MESDEEPSWILTQIFQESLKEMKKERKKERRTRLMRGELGIHAPGKTLMSYLI